MSVLADRYHEIMRFRTEALSKYHANVLSMLTGPPSTMLLPKVSLFDEGATIKRIGPFHFANQAPVAPHVHRIIQNASRPLTILEIGPGTGELAKELRSQFGSAIARYYAIDRDRSVSGAYDQVLTIDEIPETIDLVIAAEVIEHMLADDLYASILLPLLTKLGPESQMVISTPNPTSPGGVARDFTHLQRYPWYDLYAIFRLAFDDVSLARTHYVFSIRRLVQLIPRFLLCLLLELEWCDTLICIGSKPRLSSVNRHEQ